MMSLAEWVRSQQARHQAQGLPPLVSGATLATRWEAQQKGLCAPESPQEDESATPGAWIYRRPLQSP